MSTSILLGDYAYTRAAKAALEARPGPAFEMLAGKPVSHFRRYIGQMDIDIAEVPIMTFLMAHERGLPLRLLPAVVLGGTQHGYLFVRSDDAITEPRDLIGKRIGIRAYSVTTVTWMRDILEREYGIAPGQVDWVAFEEPHLSDFVSPANVVRAPQGASMEDMLAAGELDAAVLRAPPEGGGVVPLIADVTAAEQRWREANGAIQINHMICTTHQFAEARPEIVADFLSAITPAEEGAHAMPLVGRDRIDHGLSLAIDCALRQGIISKRPDLESLFGASGTQK